MPKNLHSQKGFTVVELAAVIGVLVVTTTILLVNNRVNELQLSLSKDSTSISSAVARAKALTLQNLDSSICGYGVHFAPKTNVAADSFSVFEIKNTGSCAPQNLSYGASAAEVTGEGSGAQLENGLRFVSDLNSPLLVRDIVFYSSDARVKLTGFNGQNISPAGIIIIATEAIPSSYATLKITTTGQVTSKNGAYSSPDNFDSGVAAVISNENGQLSISSETGGEGGTGSEEEFGGPVFGNENCIPDCSCAARLGSGETCSDGCGGVCYAGQPQGQMCIPTPGVCDGKTCADLDNCGAPCIGCDRGFACINKQCVVCTPNCAGKVCGDDNGCGGVCTDCPAGEACAQQVGGSYQCVPAGIELKIDDVQPPVGFK